MKPEIFLFDDQKNITIGKGRIIWGVYTVIERDDRKVIHQAGWVLPGGRRVQDKAVAELWATMIDRNAK